MRTEKQIAASRANGRKSNGAATLDGKARIVAANLKSGVYAESETLPWEKEKDLEQLKADYYDHHQPASPEARLLVDELIICEWTLRRLRRADSNIWAYSAKEAYKPDEDYAPAQSFLRCDKIFARLQHRINSTRLAYHRALKALLKLEPPTPATATPSTEAPESTLGTLRKSPTPAADHDPSVPQPPRALASTTPSPQPRSSGPDPRPLTPNPAPPPPGPRPRSSRRSSAP